MGEGGKKNFKIQNFIFLSSSIALLGRKLKNQKKVSKKDATLKGNKYVEKALVTGVLRLANEEMFSGINNITEYPFLNSKYSKHYGFN